MPKIAELPAISPLRSVDSYAQAADARDAMISERAHLQDKLKDLAARWRAAAEPAHEVEVGQQFLAERFEGAEPPEDREKLADEWRAADRRLHQLNAGIRTHEMHTFTPARGRAAAQIAQEVRPQYASAVRALDEHYGALEGQLQALADFEAELHGAGGDLRALGAVDAAQYLSGVQFFRKLIAERFGDR